MNTAVDPTWQHYLAIVLALGFVLGIVLFERWCYRRRWAKFDARMATLTDAQVEAKFMEMVQ